MKKGVFVSTLAQEHHCFLKFFVSYLFLISHRQVVAEEYVLRNTYGRFPRGALIQGGVMFTDVNTEFLLFSLPYIPYRVCCLQNKRKFCGMEFRIVKQNFAKFLSM
jgi:hypothetical protein